MELITCCMFGSEFHLVCCGVCKAISSSARRRRWTLFPPFETLGLAKPSLTAELALCIGRGPRKAKLFGERRNDGVHVAINTLIAVNRVRDDDRTPCSNPVIISLLDRKTRHPMGTSFSMELITGFEPVTSSLPRIKGTSCL